MNAGSPAERNEGAFVPRIPETVASVEVDGETVVYDEIRQRVHVLSPTASIVWGGIDGRTSLDQIAQELSEAFGAEVAIVRSDVLELARELTDKGLLSEVVADDRRPDVTDGRGRPDADEGDGPAPRFLEEPPSG